MSDWVHTDGEWHLVAFVASDHNVAVCGKQLVGRREAAGRVLPTPLCERCRPHAERLVSYRTGNPEPEA